MYVCGICVFNGPFLFIQNNRIINIGATCTHHCGGRHSSQLFGPCQLFFFFLCNPNKYYISINKKKRKKKKLDDCACADQFYIAQTRICGIDMCKKLHTCGAPIDNGQSGWWRESVINAHGLMCVAATDRRRLSTRSSLCW